MASTLKKFKPTMYVDIYRYAREGLVDTHIAQALGVDYTTFMKWRRDDKTIQYALAQGRANGPDYTLNDYIYDHLDPETRTLWDRLKEVDLKESNAVDLIQNVLRGQSVHIRQRLFIHALSTSFFNVSQSLRRVGIGKKTYDNWCRNDPDFVAMVQEIGWHKDNFFETAFMGRVLSGDTAAIIHAARTKLRHRGYNDKIEVEHTGTVQHEHSVKVTDLNLDLPTRRALLAALRAHTARADAIPALAAPVAP